MAAETQAQWRQRMRNLEADRESAHLLAAEDARRIVDDALACMAEMNFGEARELLRELVDNGLPNDHGGPVTHYPLFDHRLEQAQERRARRSATISSGD